MTKTGKHQRFLSLMKMSGCESNMARFSEKYGIPYRTIVDWRMGTSWASEYLLDFLETTIRVENGMPYMYGIVDLFEGEKIIHKTTVRGNAQKRLSSLNAGGEGRYKLIITRG